MSVSKERPYGSPNPIGRPRVVTGAGATDYDLRGRSSSAGKEQKPVTRAEAEEETRLIARAREQSRALNGVEVECFKCGNDGIWHFAGNVVVHRDGQTCAMHNWQLGVNSARDGRAHGKNEQGRDGRAGDGHSD